MKQPGLFVKQYGWLLLIAGILVLTLWLMSFIVKDAPQFVEYYALLLAFALVGTLVLVGFLIRTLVKLYQQYKLGITGIRTTLRITTTLTLLLAFPITILYYFSLNFIHHGIDQWFDVPTEQALADASALVRHQLDSTTRDHLNAVIQAEQQAQPFLIQTPALMLGEFRQRLGAQEAALYSPNRLLVAYSHQFGTQILPSAPSNNLFQQVRQGHPYAAVEKLPESEQQIVRILIPIREAFVNQVYALQVIFPLSEQLTRYAESIRKAESQYQEINYLRQPLKTSFTLILSMIFLLTLVTALLFTVQAAQNLTRPIRHLVRGTERVAQGDYSTKMQVDRDDEFGTLIQSFNDMIQQVAKARNDIKINHQQTEVQRLYFQAVIRNLTNGVITLDMNRRLRTINDKASQILGINLQSQVGQRFCDIAEQEEAGHLKPFFDVVMPQFEGQQSGQIDSGPWTQQISLQYHQQQRILLLHGSTLPSIDQKIGGFVIVLDDITDLVQAQLHAAWSDVARRLAHEIKNPLTPIQLSAERLKMKLASQLDDASNEFVDRMTRTIIDQVDTMQTLVQAFIDYAHTPEVQLSRIDLNQLIIDLVSLYQDPGVKGVILTELDDTCTEILADASRLRQLFHNLIKNALEATEDVASPQIILRTDCHSQADKIKISVTDNGSGISEQAVNWIFEPYATDKPKGSGLGLAIVKKIVEEHNGHIELSSSNTEGTCFMITLSKPNPDGR
jgi:nitrogen fixation/metabolism regulation signal transduction histidine kinase